MTMPIDAAGMTGVGYATRRVTKAPDWHTLVALDMLFNNMTTGLFLVAVAGDLVAPGVFGATTRLAYPIAMLLLLADLICLVLDLGHRLRFHHMLRVFKPTSPMSLGTWCLSAYSVPLTLLAGIETLRMMGVEGSSGLAGWIRGPALVAGIPFALGSAMYKGVLFSTTSQPGWKEARWLGGYLTNSAIAIGGVELLAIATLLGQDRAATALRPSVPVLLAINLVFLGLVAAELRPALRAIREGGRLATIFGAGAAAGVVLPAFAVLAATGPMLILVILASVVLGNLGIRWAIVMLPHGELAVGGVLDRDGSP